MYKRRVHVLPGGCRWGGARLVLGSCQVTGGVALPPSPSAGLYRGSDACTHLRTVCSAAGHRGDSRQQGRILSQRA